MKGKRFALALGLLTLTFSFGVAAYAASGVSLEDALTEELTEIAVLEDMEASAEGHVLEDFLGTWERVEEDCTTTVTFNEDGSYSYTVEFDPESQWGQMGFGGTEEGTYEFKNGSTYITSRPEGGYNFEGFQFDEQNGEECLVFTNNPDSGPFFNIDGGDSAGTEKPAAAAADSVFTFRKSSWGSTPEEVKANESGELVYEQDDAMTFKTSLKGSDAVVHYYFNSNGLYTAGYDVKDAFSSGGQWIRYYNTIKDGLIEKYGPAGYDTVIKNERDSLIESAGESNALEFGYVEYGAVWDLDNGTSIILSMSAKNYDISLMLGYMDNNALPDSSAADDDEL